MNKLKVSYNPKDRGALYGFEKSNSYLVEKLSGGSAGFFEPDESVSRRDLVLYFKNGVERISDIRYQISDILAPT